MAATAFERLREAIVFGDLTPGTRLRLEPIAQSLGMSSSPIREAVRELAVLGLAEVIPHQGARVVGLEIDELRDLFSIRLTLETIAVRRAAELIQQDEERAAQKHLDLCQDARHRADTRAAIHEHTAFHFTLFQAARSGWLLRLIRPGWESCERYRHALLAEQGTLQDRHEELDRELLASCTAHDADSAAAALLAHLELATDMYSIELRGRAIFAFE